MKKHVPALTSIPRFAVALAALGAGLSLRCGTDETGAPPSDAGSVAGAAGQPDREEPGGVPSATGCEPGATRECVGPAACRGGQACQASASWGPCDCGEPIGTGGSGNGAGGAPAEPEGGGGAGITPIPVACTPLPAGGCDAGEKCGIVVVTAAQTVSFACVPNGTRPAGAECALRADGADDCAAGLFCSGLGSVPRCQPYCDVTDATTCPTFCAALNVTVHPGTPGPSGYGVCQPTCDLLEQSCQDGDACVFFETEFPVCGEPGTVADGEDCAFFDDCGVGSACILKSASGSGAAVCTPLCDATLAGGCDDEGDACLAFPMLYDPVPDSLTTTGVCYPCALVGVPDCELLAPGGCAEEADCDPLLASMGFDYTCDVTAARCVLAAP